jgi:hypothetical protein
MAMTNAERQKKFRLMRKTEGKKRLWVQDSDIGVDAGDLARRRFEKYLDEILVNEDDRVKWEFYNFLLKKAQTHKLDYSQLKNISFAYQDDRHLAIDMGTAAMKRAWAK